LLAQVYWNTINALTAAMQNVKQLDGKIGGRIGGDKMVWTAIAFTLGTWFGLLLAGLLGAAKRGER